MKRYYDLSQPSETPGQIQYLEFYNRDICNDLERQSPIYQICARIIDSDLKLSVTFDNEEFFSKIDVSQFSSGKITKSRWLENLFQGTLYFICPLNHPNASARVYDFIQYLDLNIALVDNDTKHQLLTSLSRYLKNIKIENDETVYHNLTIQAQIHPYSTIFEHTKMLYERGYHQAWYVLAQAYQAHHPEKSLMALSALEDIIRTQKHLLDYQNAMFLKANLFFSLGQHREAFIALHEAGETPEIIQFRTRILDIFLGGNGFDEEFPLITMGPEMVIDMASRMMQLQKRVLFLESQQKNSDPQSQDFIGYLPKKQPENSQVDYISKNTQISSLK